jgi:16S rRNA (cytosine1402-N4)-methyltransferase
MVKKSSKKKRAAREKLTKQEALAQKKEPVSELASELASEPSSEPVSDPSSEPVSEPASEPVSEPDDSTPSPSSPETPYPSTSLNGKELAYMGPDSHYLPDLRYRIRMPNPEPLPGYGDYLDLTKETMAKGERIDLGELKELEAKWKSEHQNLKVQGPCDSSPKPQAPETKKPITLREDSRGKEDPEDIDVPAKKLGRIEVPAYVTEAARAKNQPRYKKFKGQADRGEPAAWAAGKKRPGKWVPGKKPLPEDSPTPTVSPAPPATPVSPAPPAAPVSPAPPAAPVSPAPPAPPAPPVSPAPPAGPVSPAPPAAPAAPAFPEEDYIPYKYLDCCGHVPVLLIETVSNMSIKEDGFYVDATMGGGGHSRYILDQLGKKGRLLSIDRDDDAIEFARTSWAADYLNEKPPRLIIRRLNFRDLKNFLEEEKLGQADAIVADLGFSSRQLDKGKRGFSFSKLGPLDMRMCREEGGKTAADIVNKLPEKELADLIYMNGEEKNSRRIARIIVEERGKKPIETTLELASLVDQNIPRENRVGHKLHPATRLFQALRIAVNDELGALEAFLSDAQYMVKRQGRLAVISFHSLEDRMVKNLFRSGAKYEKHNWFSLWKKPVQPSEEETRKNPRSRSAKLRVGIRI